MADPSDTLFIEMAIAKGYLDRPRADEALGIQRATAEDGKDRRVLLDVLVEEGWMTRQQVAEVNAQIEEGAARTGRIEGYRLLAKIGQGGMGAVYKATREATGETVALKILPARMALKQDFIERFLREARAASKVQSEHIVRTVDVGYSGGYYYFAMEYVQGESVDTTLSIDGPMTESKALRIVHDIALALRDADRAGLVHRDIKPGNILIREDGAARLTDFGLAREIADDSITQAGVALGTPNYMSPEQAKALKSLDSRSDIYSLGVTFYHMVTGTVPFHGETSLLTMLKHLNEAPVAPISRRPDLSSATNAIILKMLAKDRDERYRNPEQLAEDLELAMAGKNPRHASVESPAAPPRGPELAPPDELDEFARGIRQDRRLRWLKTAAAAAFVLLLAGLTAILFGPWDRPGNPGAGADSGRTEAARKLERLAAAALSDAKLFAQKNPDELAAIVRHYSDVETQYRATAAGAEAHKLAVLAQQKLDAAVRDAVQKAVAAAESFAHQDRFGAALEACDQFPPALRTQEAVERLELAKRDLERRAWDRFAELSGEVDRLISSKRLSAARSALDAAKDFGISGIAAEARKMLARIQTEELAADSETNRLALEEYLAAAARVRAFVRRGSFDGAVTELRTQCVGARYDLLRRLGPGAQQTLATARTVWDRVIAAIQALQPGARLTIGGAPYTFGSYDPKTDRVQVTAPGGRPMTLSPGWLPPDTLRELASSGGKLPAVSLAAFFLARGEQPLAFTELGNAKKEGAPADVVKSLEDQLTALSKTREEIEADNLLTRARDQAVSATRNPEQAARTLWELVTNYGGTACCTQNRSEIEALLAKAQAESITADTLFAVGPTAMPDRAVELKYDFSDPAQAGDWTSVWEKRSFGRWAILPRYAEMTADSGLVYFKVPLHGDFQAELSALDLRSAAVRFAMPNPTASPRANGYTFAWKRAAESAVSSLEKAGKRITPDSEVNPFRVIGAVRIALEVKGNVFSARVADRPVFRVTLPDKPEELARSGYLVLDEFNLGARVTSLVVRTKLDKDWLEKNYVEPLRNAKMEEARWAMAQYTPLLPANDASAWRLTNEPAKADWTFAQGYAIAPENAACTMTAGDADWTDYAFSAKLRFGAGQGAARLMLRWVDGTAAGAAARGYYVEIRTARSAGASGMLALGKSSAGRDETLKEAAINLTGSDWYQLYAEVRGKSLRVLLGGRELLAADDDSFASGRVGLASFRCGAQFSDIRIKLMK